MRTLAVLVGLLVMGPASGLRFFIPPNGRKCLKEEIHKNIVVKGEYELTEAPGHKVTLGMRATRVMKMEMVQATVMVTDTRGHTLYSREDFVETTGKFAFTADEYDIFEICVSTKAQQVTGKMPGMGPGLRMVMVQGQHSANREVMLKMKHGIEAKDYGELAKAEKLKPLEVELRRLEDLSGYLTLSPALFSNSSTALSRANRSALSESIVNDFAYMRSREEEMRNTNGAP